ncbi:MAG: hypothetical protein Q4F11_02985 [Eubacteriales bacterium]|nr:hypothetical protein [Eubacteriales bacterium]
MLRWFEENGRNSDVVISGKVRLARNINGYNFSLKLASEDAKIMIADVLSKLSNLEEFKDYSIFQFKDLDDCQKTAMKERHVISDFLLRQDTAAGLVSSDENISIMLNEEDHIRIQAYVSGMDIEKAFEYADNVDNVIGKCLDYSYDEKYGYLTTCPSNVGTGMRASYMLHLPALTGSGKIAGLAMEVGRFGLVLKSLGIDNSNYGDIYQVTNQYTLGKSEKEILDNLTNITAQIVKQERTLRKQYISQKRLSAQDTVYRAYGVLKYARKVSLKDGMLLLSQLRLGLAEHLIQPSSDVDVSVYQLMIGILPANLQMMSSAEMTAEDIDVARAQFIRDNIPLIQ